MKIALAQIHPKKGKIDENIQAHLKWIQLAIEHQANAIFFPELSITAYEPTLAQNLAKAENDPSFNVFQKISDAHEISIGLGLPTTTENGIHITMLIFQAHQKRSTYAKQILHEDELPFFVEGTKSFSLTQEGIQIAPAICYESLQERHLQKAVQAGAHIYLASVAKGQKGIDKAMMHLSAMAKKYGLPILMSNAVGYCDNFMCSGQSGVWNDKGELLEQLNNEEEGLLLFDTKTQTIQKVKLH